MRRLLAIAAVTLGLVSACNGTFRFDTESLADGGAEASADTDTPARRCASDTDCPSPGLRCEPVSGRCVECLADTDCASPSPHCDTLDHLCVECRATSDCQATQRCDDTTKHCLDVCVDDDDPCPAAGFVCDRFLKLCIECRESENCIGNPHGSHCDPDIGRCAECLGDAQCPIERPLCDRRSAKCVGCVEATDCAADEACSPTMSTCVALP